jgi:serine/threonine-protein kinase
MLFELVTGRQPHTADTPLAVAYKHVNETVPAPSSIVPGLPQALDDLLAAATSRDPGFRPADAGQLLHAVFETRRQLPGGSAFAIGTELHTPGPPRQSWQQPQSGAPLVLPAPPGQGLPAAPRASPPKADGQAPPQPGIFGAPGAGSLPALSTGSQRGGTSVFEDAPPMSGYRAEFFGPPAGHSNMVFGPPAARHDTLGRPAAQNNNTLIVSRGGAGHGPRPRRGLADWLFSRRAAYVAGGLAVVVLASLIVWWQASGRYTRVPDVAGLATSTAATELRNLGFQVKIGNPQVDNQVPKGEAARTVPGSGSHALNGATITVIPSAGPRRISVPNVTGQVLANAQKALQAAGLTPGAVQQETSPTVPQNEVISTDPPAGTSWPQTKPVKLMVSAGIGLPDFTGQPRQVAEQWLQQHQLQVQEQQQNSTSQPQDNVIKQSPAANSPITQGEVVTLYISTGPPIVQIPNVTGMSVPDASKQLEALGFQVSVVGFGRGKVIAFQPTGQAPKGATITLLAGPGGG